MRGIYYVYAIIYGILLIFLLICSLSLFKTFKIDSYVFKLGDGLQRKSRIYSVLMNSDLTLGNLLAIYKRVGDGDALIRDAVSASVIMFGKPCTLELKQVVGETAYFNVINGEIYMNDRLDNRLVMIYISA